MKAIKQFISLIAKQNNEMSFDKKLKTINDFVFHKLESKFIETNVRHNSVNSEQIKEKFMSWIKNFGTYGNLLVDTCRIFNIETTDLFSMEMVMEISERLLQSCFPFELKRLIIDINRKTIELNQLSEEMRQKCLNAREEYGIDSNKIKEKIKFYEEKRQDYYQKIKTFEIELKNIGFTSDLKTDSMDQMRDNNRKLEKELDLLKEKLDFFDFESNEKSLKDKINEMRKELEKFDIKS